MRNPLLTAALLLGLLIAYVDSRPGWDDTIVTVMVLLILSGVFGFLGPERPWLWALCLGIWIPLLEIPRDHNSGALMALVVAFAGAYVGMAARRTLTPGSR